MYSAFAAAADANAVDESSYLFGQSHDDIMSLPTSHESTLLKASVPTIPISGIDNLMYGHYNESIPSSIHYTGINEVSEASGSHTSTRDGGDGSLYSGYETRHERSYTPSLLHSTQPNQNSRSNGLSNGTFYLTSIKPDSERTLSPIANGTIAPGPQAIPYSTIRDINGQHSIARSLQTPEQDPKSHSSPEPSKVQTVADSRYAAYANAVNGKGNELRANSSIPDAMSWEEFARQSILGAESSRLNPFALHVEEYKLLRSHITHTQVTTYLNIRNAILRLWTKNPLVNVTMEEAAGCARDKRYFGLAKVAYYWLLRNGYINFGCVEVTNTAIAAAHPQTKLATQKKVLVIGAGMAGLGCARQLEGLFSQLGDQWANGGQQPPKVTVLEARPRVGGRVYSHPLRDQTRSSLPCGHRCTAEMGAQIVTGFERGNPMNTLIRGQLGLPYHGLRDNTILYDYDGTIVERSQDLLVEKLYNDVLERASIYRHKPSIFRTVEGDRNLILFGRDPNDSGGPTIATLENSQAPLPASATTTASTTEETPSSGVEKLAGRAYQLSSGFNPSITAAETAGNMGWELNSRATKDQTVNLDSIAKASQYPTLGKTMDEGIRQYQAFLDLKPQDLRLLNWHHANLEYANAVSVNQLSLSGWDQDIGNEFEGEHTEVIGGYQQVPRGLWQCPGKLDVRFKSVVKTISYSTEKGTLGKAVRVECHNGEVHEADQLVITTPLGVLKSGSIGFEPALPEWKEGVIERMGFGLLNKVILVYEEAFWEPHRDMFGLLNEAEHQASLNPEEYAARRGRFYLFWNCIKTSGRPTLVALMAGDAAYYAEATSNDQLIREVTDRLTKMFAPKRVPLPSETIVTRWSKDPFACGSYSYVGPKTQAGDYDVMARPLGPLHFAGEATCSTHPATVHGAYLSGLRAAAEVVEDMIGPIQVPSPLVERKAVPVKLEQPPTPVSMTESKHQLEPESHAVQNNDRYARQLRDEAYEASIIGAILTEIGERPIKPGRAGVNPFLLYTKDHWYACKKDCDEKRKKATGDPNAKASKTEIRIALGLMWRTASADIQKPYLDKTQSAKDDAAARAVDFTERVASWDREASRIRREYIQNNPPANGDEDVLLNGRTAIEMGTGKRVRRT